MSLVFPAPAIVVGVGRFGLAALERLGEDWMGLRLSGADVSLDNLRLLAVLPDGAEDGWRRHEHDAVHIAGYLGDSDLPSLAVDLAILRSLGLVRFRDGSYQLALPRDTGAVEIEERDEDGVRKRLVRRRYFEWVKLSPDPVVAAERLRHLAQRLQEVDLFVTPVLNRVKQGHSPWALLACLDRCRAYLDGRDPAPWGWLDTRERPAAGEPRLPQRIEVSPNEAGEPPGPGEEREPSPAEIVVPFPFVRLPSDVGSPLDPVDLLDRDWANTGWASSGGRTEGEVFELEPLSPPQLGLFDHDGREGSGGEGMDGSPQETAAALLDRRLRELGDHLHRGLVRLWVDLQRERVAEPNINVLEKTRQRDELSEALQQTLEVLGEILVRPLTDNGAGVQAVPDRSPSAAETELPTLPSDFLAGLEVGTREKDSSPLRLLEDRLTDLGLGDPAQWRRWRRPLLETEHLTVPLETAEPGCAEHKGLRNLRLKLNQQVRQLFDFTFLTRYRNRPTRRPPRLTVFVVGDMSEAFTREAMRPVLREIHAELLRAFTPIFESYREGFDRCLCVTPILWMPHPADPFQGAGLELSRCEEAAIIDAVHGIRRWVECVLPPGRRCVHQIFVNSRVSDTAALSLADALRQTRDFIAFQTRNDLSADSWLRQTSTAAGGGDLFSSFSCYEIDFPALRCREYLANRLARECLAQLKEGEPTDVEPPEPFEPKDLDELADKPRKVLGEVTRDAAQNLASEVRARLDLSEATSYREVLQAFDERFGESLKAKVWARWSELTGRQGRVDDLVDELRLKTSRLMGKTVTQVRDYSDALVQENAGAGGLTAALASFQGLKSTTRDSFQKREARRREKEALCERHGVPDLRPLKAVREGIEAAAARKPDLDPVRFGLALWAALSLVLGAPLAHGAAYLLDLHLRPNLIELLLGPGGAIVGGLALWLPVRALLRWHMRRRLALLEAAVERLADEVHGLLWGAGQPPERETRVSVRSFLESRLELTAAVAARGFALSVLERAVADARLGHRLARSVDVQAEILMRQAEDLGVRVTLGAAGGRRESLRGLFERRTGDATDRLIDAEKLAGYYARRVGQSLYRQVPGFIEAAGGFGPWREEACLADGGRLLQHGRDMFEDLVSEAVSDQHFFADEVGERLMRFIARNYSNLGFGAGFKGYEGLDPDNVLVLADATLVIHEGLQALFRAARQRYGRQFPITDTMEVHLARTRPNAAYMLSLVQGVRVHSLRNLRRFESFHNRVALPDDRMFPLSHEPRALGPAMNPLTGFEAVGADLAAAVLQRNGKG
ncbi:MAG TPA: hypothetical protein VEL74_13875 [Thermoanaerobaculia bacterium]|nr:hypothetical protein [Thermoanaerobaculia bacterium]